MKINTNLNLVGIDSSNHSGATRARQAAATPHSEENASALSSAVRLLSASLQNGTEVRSSRVEPLRQAVASGQYRVDAAAVADSMMRELS